MGPLMVTLRNFKKGILFYFVMDWISKTIETIPQNSKFKIIQIMLDHVLKVRSIGEDLETIEHQAIVKNETDFIHERDCSNNNFKQSQSSAVNEHSYKNIFVDLISIVLPLVVVGIP